MGIYIKDSPKSKFWNISTNKVSQTFDGEYKLVYECGLFKYIIKLNFNINTFQVSRF